MKEIPGSILGLVRSFSGITQLNSDRYIVKAVALEKHRVPHVFLSLYLMPGLLPKVTADH